MTIFYLNGTAEDKINDTLAYTSVSDVSPVYSVDSVGSKVVDGDFVDPVYSAVNPAYNNQKPTFYPFASNAAGQSINVAGNTQLPHDNSATVVRVTNDASSVRSGLFNMVAGKWDSTYVPTTNGYGLCEDREDTLTYAGQDQEYSINTTELTTCDQSTLVLPSITPLPTGPLVTGIFNLGDPAFAYSDITSNLTYRGSIYLDTNNSSTAYEIPEVWFGMEIGTSWYRCNDNATGTGAMVLANSDNSLMYYSAKTFTSDGYMSTPTNGFNAFGNWGGGTNTLIPEHLRDRGQLRFDIYNDCDNKFTLEFAVDSNNWAYWNFEADLANGLYNDKVFMKSFSPEMVESLKEAEYLYFYYYNGDFSEFNFDTDTDWGLIQWKDTSLYSYYVGRSLDIHANPTLTSLDLSAVDIERIDIFNNPNFTHLENVNNYSWVRDKRVNKSDGTSLFVYGSRIMIGNNPNFTQQNFNEIIDAVYQKVAIEQPYAPTSQIRAGSMYITQNVTVDSTRQAKIDVLKAEPFRWTFYLNGVLL